MAIAQAEKDALSSGKNRHEAATGRPDEAVIARWLADYVRHRDEHNAAEQSAVSVQQAELKSRIAHHFTPLVESVARRFMASGEPQEDLIQEGFLGLLSALEHYDPTKGVKFSTYATHFIAGAIRHCLRDRGKIIKEPAWLHELSNKIARTTDALTQSLGRTPSPIEIARVLNLTEESVQEVLANRAVFQVSAFASSSDDNDESMLGLVDPEKIRSDRYQTLQLPMEDRIVLEESLTKLKALEQSVLYEFFYKDLSQTEIARKMGISCNYVSHILRNSTQKLRKIIGEADVRDRTRTRESSIIEASSGLFTRNHILARLDEELSRAARINRPMAILVVTIEGMPASGLRREEVWNVCGEAVRKAVRRVDVAGHYGSDSLLILLPQTGLGGTAICERVVDCLLTAGAVHHIPFNVRFGFAVFPDQGRTTRELLAAATQQENHVTTKIGSGPLPMPA